MSALPARNNIRNVASGDIEARPRDAALRKSANDRAAAYIRQVRSERTEDQQNPYPTVSQDFEQYSESRTIQPTNSPSRNVNVQQKTRQGTNQTRRVQAQATNSYKRGGQPLKRPSLKRAIPNVPILDVSPVKLAKATTVSMTNISWGMGLWFSIQLPLAIVSIVLFGLTYIVEDVVKQTVRGAVGETLYSIGETIFSSAASAVSWLIGFDINQLLDPSGYFVLAHMLVFIIGFATLILMGIIYQISLVNCVFGKNAALKIGTLIFACFGYMIPLLNIIPWFIFWVLVVWRYPE